ncbi:MAG: hypothetical protein M1825_002329 [Sarcosagium campestre]|nr:MAG: hypothetical protein M1825_002329 [Sarcosagium campestre]
MSLAATMLNRNDYTVGWICAIATEGVAARVFLDEVHGTPEDVLPNDNNCYTLGKVGKHNVVIAVLPNGEYGIASAASVASNMLHSFPKVRFGLMVGIGGGAPSPKHDIRLGDIVVSSPCEREGGVFQYDFGKTIQEQQFHPIGFLNQPPMVLRTAVTGLICEYEVDGHRLKETIDSILEKNQRLRLKYGRPDLESDILYQPGFIHSSNNEESCAEVCGDHPSNLMPRTKRTEHDDDPTIHYGLIASANQLMKDASVRDMLAKEKGVLCFEMEAAGLMNHFPCLVIRGICDYSDSHKNKAWQGYAAMAAAAYAKDLLYRIPPNKVEAEKSIQDILSCGLNEIRDTAQGIGNDVKSLDTEHKQGKIESWLRVPDSSTDYNKALQQRHKDSGRWFLESKAFAEWKIRRNSFLWLYGIPGCGKTILSSTIVQNLGSTLPSPSFLYFYFTFTEPDKQSLDGMIRSLIGQIYFKYEDVRKQLDLLFSACSNGHQQPTTASLCTTFLHMLQQVGEVWIVLDALDESHARKGKQTEGILLWMRDLLDSKESNIHILMTSRQDQHIESEIRKWARGDDIVPVQGDGVTNDVCAYIHTRVREGDDLKRWRLRPEVQDEIEAKVMEKAAGMFRLAACQLDALKDCLDYRVLTKALASLPKTLYETYDRILDSISESHRDTATRILQLLIFSERPLRIEEAVDAVAVDPKGKQHFNPENRMPVPQEISRYCSSLVVVVLAQELSEDENDKELVLQLAHFSVKEYLTSSRVRKEFAQVFRETTAKASIATVCLAYLLHLDQDLGVQRIRRDFPFAQYCAQYWMEHAAESKEQDKELRCLAMEFFLHKESYTNCYHLYVPDRPWYDSYIHGKMDPPAALYYASFGNLIHAVGDLIQGGADVNAQGGHYGNALYGASYRGHDKIVELLLGRGADVNAQGGFYGNALQAASYQGHDMIIELLLGRDADVNAQGGDFGNALQAASYQGHDMIIELLLGRDADVNAQGGHCGNALYGASYRGHDKIVELLLGRGADVNAQGGFYGNALQAASYKGHDKIVELLLGKDADVNAQGGFYGNALQAVSYKGHDKIVELLLGRDADVNAQGRYGNALQAASYGGHDKTFKLLLSAQGGY